MTTPRRDDAPRKVLVVSYFYPPFQSVGALRISKITKHLSEFGWTPIVLTVESQDLPTTMALEIPAASIHRTRSYDVNRIPKLVIGRRRIATRGFHVGRRSLAGRLLTTFGNAYRDWTNFPDGQVGWYPFAVRKGLEIIERERPDLIYSSALPATSHMVAHRLSALTAVPWIGEFRDPWTDNPNYVRPKLLRPLERRMEERVMATASALVAVTPERQAELATRFGKPTAVVPNGFDPDDYPPNVPLLHDFTITFTGMVYPGRQTAKPLFEALFRLRQEGLIPPRLRVRLVGRNVEELAREAAEVGVPEMVETSLQVDRASALRMQVESTVLLLLLWFKDGDAWYPAKMFEYFGAQRPILALGSVSNEAARLLAQRGVGTVAPDADAAEATLRRWFKLYLAGGAAALTTAAPLVEFERRRLVSRLASVFDDVTGAVSLPPPEIT